jgi:signal transduction histidine kinase
MRLAFIEKLLFLKRGAEAPVVVPDESRRLLADISHELQTPIAILQGSVEIVRRKNSEETDRAVRVMESTLAAMSRLIGSLLENERLKNSKNTFDRTRISVKDLIEESYEDCLILAENKEIRFSISSDEDIFVRGEKGKLKEVILNLISNAFKYTPAGGTVLVDVCRSGERVCVSVRDTGIGILANDLLHVFDRYYRIANGGVPSVGIGLNICRQIVELHGGVIRAESVRGKGSVFTVELPADVSSAIINP